MSSIPDLLTEDNVICPVVFHKVILDIELTTIQKTQQRCLNDWSFAEHFPPHLLFQVLHNATQNYRCIDSYYHTQDNSLLIVLHNPMNQRHQFQESWNVALHSDVGFRDGGLDGIYETGGVAVGYGWFQLVNNVLELSSQQCIGVVEMYSGIQNVLNYLELVASSIDEWILREEAKYQEEKMAKELEALRLAKEIAEKPPEDVKPSTSGKKGAASKKSKSPPKSKVDVSPEPLVEKEKNIFVRDDSLKAWKEEQERLLEEERLKELKKAEKKEKPSAKKKGQSKEQPASEEGKASKKKSSKEKSKSPSKSPEAAKSPDSEDQSKVQKQSKQNIPPLPPEKDYEFLGYNMGENPIQVAGTIQYLFPTDGGQIQAEKIIFEKGATLVKVKVIKDHHSFFVHIIDPQEGARENKNIQESFGSLEDQESKSENSVPQEKAVSKFGSFSATLENEIHISFSCYGSSGKAAEEKDPDLAAILSIPSVNVPTSTFVTSAVSAATVSTAGKVNKSGKEKSAKSVPSAKVSSRLTVTGSPEDSSKQEKLETDEPFLTEAIPEARFFNNLNASCPNGLVLTFLGEMFSAEEKGSKAKIADEGSKIDETNLDEARVNEIKIQEAKMEQLQTNEAIANKAYVNRDKSSERRAADVSAMDSAIRNESNEGKAEVETEEDYADKVKEYTFEILIRQSYPQRVKHSQLQKAVKKPVEQEVSRVITRQGTVVKYMLDGSTQILFSDGTVIKSPDSGPVIPPPPPPSTPHTEVLLSPEISTKKSRLECLYLVLGDRDRLGILLVYRAPFCPTVYLPELTETVSDLVLRTPRMLVLGDFNLHAEASLTGAAQDFMASMTAMGLSQHVTGPTHERGHTLDLVFSTGQEEGGLRVSNLCLTPLSWSDHFLVRFVLESDFSLCTGADPIMWVRPRSWMDPEGFLKALGEFPADKTGAPVEALVELWNGEMTRAVDTIAPKHPLPPGRARSSPWYTPELRAMKQVGRRLERRWRKSRDESDRTHLRAHYRAYAVAVRVAKKRFFSASIASSQCRPVELFRVVQGLVRPGPKEDLIPPSKARCDDFARHFREKIAQIRHELDTSIDSEVSKETPTLPSGPDLLDEFQLLRPDDVDKVL
ncbi:Sperm-associated antigen 17, partial [Varanus komodoensis]